MLPVIALGAGALLAAGIKGYTDYKSSEEMAAAYREAMRRQQEANQGASRLIGKERDALGGYFGEAAGAQQAGYAKAQSQLQTSQDELANIYAQERSTGASALERLNQAVLGGDMSALQLDPGYQFRMQEGQKAMERAAIAAGSFGSGSNLKDFMRFGQGLASQEYQAAVARLAGLSQIGIDANRAYAAQYQQGQANLANLSTHAGDLYAQNRLALAGAQQNLALAQANALTGNASQLNQLALGQAQAQGGQYQAIGSAFGNLAGTGAGLLGFGMASGMFPQAMGGQQLPQQAAARLPYVASEATSISPGYRPPAPFVGPPSQLAPSAPGQYIYGNRGG